MRSPYDPLPEDIRVWAYQKEALEPAEDWDLILSWLPNDDLYLNLAGDSNCPNQSYFLKLLYRIVGDGVRTNFRNRSEDSLRNFVEKGVNGRPYSVHLWAKRSLQLLSNPNQFDYDNWCAGNLVMIVD